MQMLASFGSFMLVIGRSSVFINLILQLNSQQCHAVCIHQVVATNLPLRELPACLEAYENDQGVDLILLKPHSRDEYEAFCQGGTSVKC